MAVFIQRPSGNWQARIRRDGWPAQSKTFPRKSDAEAWATKIERDKPPSHFLKENTLGQFFRHPSGHQRKDCSFQAAKLAALHLLMERGEIDLPPPRRTGVQHGVSGTTYTEVAEGRRWHGRITDKVWLDSQSAKITLEGRTVLVQLQARTGLSSEQFDGVITIRVNDPVVASWEPDQILEALRLDGDFSCWDKHWDDEELEADARRKALAIADKAMDALPPELSGLDGLTNLQKSETVLHAIVKDKRARRKHLGRVLVQRLVADHGLGDAAAAKQLSALIYKKKEPLPITRELWAELEAEDQTLKDLHWHDLRHEATSRLAERLEMHELMKVTGHKSSTMLAAYYHPDASRLAEKIDPTAQVAAELAKLLQTADEATLRRALEAITASKRPEISG